MKISVSNIAWTAELDKDMYQRLQRDGFSGVEIAPTRIFPDRPYEHNEEAGRYAAELKEQYQLTIPSMQSIWFGQTDNMFANKEARMRLLAYTKQAILFAEAIACKNLVFGCPKNRNMPEALTQGEQQKYYDVAVAFFSELAEYASLHHTVLAMEANPPIYHTNFINGTRDAYQLVRAVNHPGFLINLDVGTMIQNGEEIQSIALEKMLPDINHIHISEPGLAPIQRRKLHEEIRDVLRDGAYEGFVSLEMGRQEDTAILKECMDYMIELFGQK